MKQRLNGFEPIRKTNRITRLIAAAGAIICIALVTIHSITSDWHLALSYFVALFFAIANYFSAMSAENNAEVAVALHYESTELRRQLANAEEVKMYEIRDYNRKLAKYWEENK